MDTISKEKRSANMRAIRSRNTSPEMIVRRLVHRLGYRYRLHVAKLPGKPDLAFRQRKKVIFIHGCYWHQHGCKDSHVPKSNLDYWLPKLERNQKRDTQNIQSLREDGWSSLVVWECETKDLDTLERRIVKFLA